MYHARLKRLASSNLKDRSQQLTATGSSQSPASSAMRNQLCKWPNGDVVLIGAADKRQVREVRQSRAAAWTHRAAFAALITSNNIVLLYSGTRIVLACRSSRHKSGAERFAALLAALLPCCVLWPAHAAAPARHPVASQTPSTSMFSSLFPCRYWTKFPTQASAR